MDPETAAQYAQYYQDLYRQSEEFARDLQNTQGSANPNMLETDIIPNEYMEQYNQNLNPQLRSINGGIHSFKEQISNGGGMNLDNKESNNTKK